MERQPDGRQNNRLEIAKQAFRAFVQGSHGLPGRHGDLIGMVTFARYTDSVCPLTLDHDLLLALLDQVDIVTLPEENGTAIGEAIALGVERLRQNLATSRVMILLTDGSNNAGDTEPLQAAQIARALGVKIYTIGVVTASAAAAPGQAGGGQMVRQSVPGLMDEFTLMEIARVTGGRYFQATDGAALQAVYSEIDRLEKTPILAEHYQRYVERFSVPLLLGLAGVLLEIVLVNTCLRTLP